MADIEIDLEKGLKEGGWGRRCWKQKVHFDKNNKNITIKLKTDCVKKETLIAKVNVEVKE